MKKESKNHKAAHYSRFILLVIFTLIIVDGMFAQCTDVTPASGCLCTNNVNVDHGCISCYPAPNLTDLKKTGVGPTASVTINATGFGTITNVKVENIIIYNAVVPCEAEAGGTFATSADFNKAGFGITITDGEDHVTLVSSTTNSLTGFHINFIVNVYNGSTIVASRNYFTKVPSASLVVGDTHITTVDGVKYDFQAVGEFVVLLAEGGDNLEIQARQTKVATSGPGFDPYDSLQTCVSVNTAVAARVGTHRVTYQPDIINGRVDSSSVKLRVDGTLTELDDNGLDLGSGGRVMKSPAGGGAIQIDFPDGASLIVTPGWWSRYEQWYLNISINNAAARKGISGAIAFNDTALGISRRTKSWLPALPDGTSVGPMPQSLHQRFVTLYQTFADAWRVTDATSLFDYAPGTSTATFTDKNWPAEQSASCSVAGQIPNPPIDRATAEQLTIDIVDPNLRANAIYDVMLTGEPTFAQIYLLTQKIQTSTTAIGVYASKDTTKSGEAVTFTATVARKFSAEKGLAGSVEFTADGKNLGQVKLDANGHATFTTSSLEVGQHQVAARFIPDSGSTVFPSSSLDVTHTVIGGTPIWSQWWFWALLILLLIILFLIFRKKKP